MKYTCIIIDDEPLAHQVLKNHISRIQGLDLRNSFYNAVDAENWLNNNSADIILLDIQMPEITGLDLLRSLKLKPVTILTTAYRNYAIEGFELGVIDYLLKPIPFNRFKIAVNRAMDFIRLSKTEDTIDFNNHNDEENYELLIKTGTTKMLLDYRNISYVQGLKDYTILHTAQKKYVVKGSVKKMEDYLPSSFFLRVHKSFIVAKINIKMVHKNKIEFNNIQIPVGRSYKLIVDDFFNKNG